MNAYVNGANERRMKQILEEEMPGLPARTSSGVLPEIYSSTSVFSTTVVNAALSPVLVTTPPAIGGTADAGGLHARSSVVAHRAVRDDAGERQGFRRAPRRLRHCGGRDRQPLYRDAVRLSELDRPRHGGTSTDVSLTYEGQSRVTRIGTSSSATLSRFFSIEVRTIGAGRGLARWADEAGSLRNGPQIGRRSPGLRATATVTGRRPIPMPMWC